MEMHRLQDEVGWREALVVEADELAAGAEEAQALTKPGACFWISLRVDELGRRTS